MQLNSPYGKEGFSVLFDNLIVNRNAFFHGELIVGGSSRTREDPKVEIQVRNSKRCSRFAAAYSSLPLKSLVVLFGAFWWASEFVSAHSFVSFHW